MTLKKWIGFAIGFIGIIPVLMTQTGAEELMDIFSFFSLPALAIMAAAASSAYGWVLLRKVVQKERSSSLLMTNGMSMLLGGLFAFVHSFFVESWSPLPLSSEALIPFLKGIGVIMLISNIICYNVYGLMLRRMTATMLSMIGLLSPIFASLCEWFILGTLPSWQIFVSTGVVMLGLGIVYYAELKQGYHMQKSACQITSGIKDTASSFY
jgi:drug/metabolite transporter (DMT)-like permease